MEKPMFITVHGVDGTGKTTTVEALYKTLNANGIPCVNYDTFAKRAHPAASAKTDILKNGSPEQQFAYYLISLLQHSQNIRSILSEGYTVVKARYTSDVIAHHAFLKVKNTEHILALFPSILEPDFEVTLILDEDERKRRLIDRGILDDKDTQSVEPESRLHFFQEYLLQRATQLKIVGKSLVCNTTNNPVQEVIRQIYTAISILDPAPGKSGDLVENVYPSVLK